MIGQNPTGGLKYPSLSLEHNHAAIPHGIFS